MNQEEIIALAHKNTGQRAANIGIDASAMLLAAVQEFCGEHRWYWRKKRFSFSTVASTATYDLTDSAIADITDLDELISLWRIDSSSSKASIEPITDEEDQIAALDDTTTGDPTGYFWEDGTDMTLRLVPIPSAVKTVRGRYWAIPSTIDSSEGTVPLVPGRLHNVLVKRLESMFLAALPEGQGTEESVTRLQEYQYLVASAKSRDRLSPKEKRKWVSTDYAVRST
jgi:hypothetical protein